eukprot:COSAG02_NODE_1420_length_12692_cov_3.543397_6_plen_74_part_00
MPDMGPHRPCAVRQFRGFLTVVLALTAQSMQDTIRENQGGIHCRCMLFTAENRSKRSGTPACNCAIENKTTAD